MRPEPEESSQEEYSWCRMIYFGALRCVSISLSSCSTHFLANISSVNRLLEARARFLISNVASSDIENA